METMYLAVVRSFDTSIFDLLRSRIPGLWSATGEHTHRVSTSVDYPQILRLKSSERYAKLPATCLGTDLEIWQVLLQGIIKH